MKRVNKKIVGVLVLLVSIGSFYLLKQVQKHEKTSQQETKQKYIDIKPEKPIIHVIDDNKFVFVASNKPERNSSWKYGQNYVIDFTSHQLVDKTKSGNKEDNAEEYFKVIAYDINTKDYNTKEIDVFDLLGNNKDYRISRSQDLHFRNLYFINDQDYVAITKKSKVDGANEDMILNISTGQLDDAKKFGDLKQIFPPYGNLDLAYGDTLKDLEKILLEKYNLVLMPGYIEKGVSKNGEKIDLSNTNIAEEYPDLAKDINQLERLYMRPKQYNSKEWFDTVLHWFAPKGQDVLEVYATDPKSGEKTQIKSYDELMVWSANHPE